MKTNLLTILILLGSWRVFGQDQVSVSPVNDGIIEWDYSCHDSYTHYICFGDAAFYLDNLYPSFYLMNVDLPNEYNDFEVILEPSDHYNWDGEDGVVWEWLREDIDYDTLGLVFCGRNEDLVAGSNAPVIFTIEPYAPYHKRSAQVQVYIATPYYISGPVLACSSPVSFNLEQVPTTHTSVSWQIKQGSTVISSGTENTASASISSNGNYQVIYNMHFDCGLTDLTYLTAPSLIRNFHFGPYSSSDYEISGPSSAPCQSYVYYSIPQLEGVTSINWTWPQNWTYVSGQGTRYLALRTGNYSGAVAVGVNNDCGSCGSYDTQYTSVYGYCGYSMVITPNPATDLINITIKEPEISNLDSIQNLNSSKESEVNNHYKIMITDSFGRIYNEFLTSQKTFDFSISHLKQGNYYITASKGEINFSTQFIVNH